MLGETKKGALNVLDQGILLRRDVAAGLPHDAGHGRRPGEALLLGEEFERPVAAAAGGNLEHAGFLALGVEERSHIEALQEAAAGDVLGQFLDRDAGLQAPDIGLREDELVEGDVARGAEGDFLTGGCHDGLLRDGRREPLSRLPTRHGNPLPPLTLRVARSASCDRPPLREIACG